MKNRITAAILAALMILTTLACSCNAGADDKPAGTPTQTTPAAADTTADVTQPAETEIKPDIPDDLRYDNYQYIIGNAFHEATKYTTNLIAPESATGDILNDAIYTRTLKTEEMLGIKVVDMAATNNQMMNSIASNSDDFSVMTVDLSGVLNFINKGYVVDFYEIDTIDLEKPWWDQNAQEKLAVKGNLYYTFNDSLITGLDNGRALYFNKELHRDLGLDDIYTIVNEGKWTMDKMHQMGLTAIKDLDGDQKMTDKDRYGMLCWNATSFYEIYLTSCDAEIVKQGADGVPYFFALEPEFNDVCNFLLDTFSKDDFTLLNGDQTINQFKEGQGLFCSWTLYGATRLRDMATDFGIVAYPKLDEKQASYWHVSPNPHAYMVPVTSSDLERTGYILEGMAYQSYGLIPEAYYEMAVKGKATRDEESVEQLDLIKNTISYIIKLDKTNFTSLIYAYFGAKKYEMASLQEKWRDLSSAKLTEVIEGMTAAG